MCVICSVSPYTDDGDRTHVYILNLNSNKEISAEPILRIRYFKQWASTCVVNSTIYFIEGLSGQLGGPRNPGTKSVFFYKLPSSQPTPPTPVLDYTTLRKTAPMTGIKYRPLGIPTPDYKAILVFSTHISLDFSTYISECVSFELYNLATNKWDVLPELFPCLERSDSISIRAYTFFDESTFLIQAEDGRIFTLNLKSPRCWKSVDYDMFGGTDMVGRRFTDRFFGLGNGLVMDCAQFYDINCKRNTFIPLPEELKFPPSLDERYKWYGYRRSMTFLPSTSANESSFCVMYPLPLHVSPGLFYRPRFCINVHRFDLATCYDKSTGQYKPNNMKSFKFVLANCRSVQVTDLFPMEEQVGLISTY